MQRQSRRENKRIREKDKKIDRPINNYDKSPIKEDDFESDIDVLRRG